MGKLKEINGFSDKEIVEVYQAVLSGQRKSLPQGIWNCSNGKRNFSICLRYLIQDVLRLSHKEVCKLYNINFLIKYKSTNTSR